jgi:hypothetical protein
LKRKTEDPGEIFHAAATWSSQLEKLHLETLTRRCIKKLKRGYSYALLFVTIVAINAQ